MLICVALKIERNDELWSFIWYWLFKSPTGGCVAETSPQHYCPKMLISVLGNEAVLDLELLLDTSWKIHLFHASDISPNARGNGSKKWQKLNSAKEGGTFRDNPKLHFWFRLTDQQKNLFWIDFEKFSTGDSLCVEIANKGILNAFFLQTCQFPSQPQWVL